MKKIPLEVRIDLEKKIKQTKNLNERIRLCVVLARDDNFSPKIISNLLRISESSVYDYLKEFDEAGKTTNKTHPGRECKFTKEQENELRSYLSVVKYSKIAQVCAYVEAKYGLNYTIPGMRAWLIRNSFACKRNLKIFFKNSNDRIFTFNSANDDLTTCTATLEACSN